MNKLVNQIIDQFTENGIIITIPMAEQFETYYKMMIEYNNHTNLTAITEPSEVICKHFVDSCVPHFIFKNNSTVCDIGAGAGFPSIPLKIIRPDLKMTMIDSLQKRVTFLNEVISALGLKNISAIHSRAQEFALVKREQFDYTVARAVAQLNALVEYCLPLTKIGGQFIAYKSQSVHLELCKANQAITVLGGRLDNIFTTDLILNPKYKLESENKTEDNNKIENKVDSELLERNIVVINKVISTPKQFPRQKDKILKNPL